MLGTGSGRHHRPYIYIHKSIDVNGVSYWLCWILDLVHTIDPIYINNSIDVDGVSYWLCWGR